LTEVHTLQFDVRDKKAVSEQINSLPEAFSKLTFSTMPVMHMV
jgi:NADP-dependent 3-hydroxy acid dehydrogenase YdfG